MRTGIGGGRGEVSPSEAADLGRSCESWNSDGGVGGFAEGGGRPSKRLSAIVEVLSPEIFSEAVKKGILLLLLLFWVSATVSGKKLEY